MSEEKKQKYTDAQYLEAGESYFDGDDLTSNHTYTIVKTRKKHDCMGVDHKEERTIPAGSKALCEKAIHTDDGRVSCYVCLPCLDEWCADLFPNLIEKDESEIKVFRFTDSGGETSFYAGKTFEDCKNHYLSVTGMNEEWFTHDVSYYELEEEDMKSHFVEGGDSFRQTLDLMIMNGEVFPCAFAFESDD